MEEDVRNVFRKIAGILRGHQEMIEIHHQILKEFLEAMEKPVLEEDKQLKQPLIDH